MRLFTNRLSIVWIGLLLASALTAVLTEQERGIRWATVSILLIAAAKIGLIMAEFMELRSAPRAWKVAYGAWLTAIVVIVVSGFVID